MGSQVDCRCASDGISMFCARLSLSLSLICVARVNCEQCYVVIDMCCQIANMLLLAMPGPQQGGLPIFPIPVPFIWHGQRLPAISEINALGHCQAANWCATIEDLQQAV
jgi:hypothetical protein